MIDNGVDSLKKIRRMKSVHYIINLVANIYKAACDAIWKVRSLFICIKDDLINEWKVAQRELATGFYYQTPTENEQLFRAPRKIPQYKFGLGEVVDFDPSLPWLRRFKPTGMSSMKGDQIGNSSWLQIILNARSKTYDKDGWRLITRANPDGTSYGSPFHKSQARRYNSFLPGKVYQSLLVWFLTSYYKEVVMLWHHVSEWTVFDVKIREIIVNTLFKIFTILSAFLIRHDNYRL